MGPVTGVRPVGTLQKFLFCLMQRLQRGKMLYTIELCNQPLRLRLGSLYTWQLLNSLVGFVVSLVFIAVMSLIGQTSIYRECPQRSLILQSCISLHFTGDFVSVASQWHKQAECRFATFTRCLRIATVLAHTPRLPF